MDTAGVIKIERLSYRFEGAAQDALQEIDLRVEAGEFLVVNGASGCGKSTLALAIGGYLFHQFAGQTRGALMVDGIDVRQAPVYETAEIVGLVQQNPEAQFCTLTVQDEIAFGLENRCLPVEEIQRRLDWSLEVVQGSHLAGRDLASLSGGEKQKVAIAAMMAARPKVLIFDEPTSNLDPSATSEIFRVIAGLREQAALTVIVFEHKVEYLAAFQPRLVSMQAGKIVRDRRLRAGERLWSLPAPRKARQAPGASDALVSVEALDAAYDGVEVLHGVSTTVRAGEFVAIMGDNGSGKSTFLNCLMGLHKPARGRIEVLGQDSEHTPVHQQARRVGLLFQNPEHQLFAGSVWEEAILAPRNFGVLDAAIEAEASNLLVYCELGGRRADHPYRLSYGQKRRLNLVSILTYHPRLFLLDEILIGQDPENAGFLLDLLCQHAEEGGAVLMVNHAPYATLQYATRLLFFESGRLVIDSPVAEAFEQLAALGKTSYLPQNTPARLEPA